MKSLLIFPPGWTPFSPYLALPILKGSLEEYGINIEIRDENIEFYDYIFSKKYLSEAYFKCLKMFKEISNDENRDNDLYFKYSKAIMLKDSIENIELAKSILRSKEFYILEKRDFAWNVLKDALYLINMSYEGLKIEFNRIKLYYSEKRTNELMESIIDEDRNPFIKYFKDNIIKEINNSEINFIGISVTGSSQLIPAITLAKLIKENCKLVKHIMLGGNLITRLISDINTEHEIFRYIDSVIVYEGEVALRLLIEAINNDCSIENIPNICYIRDGKIIKNKVITIECKELSIPNFDGFSLEKYFVPQVTLPLYTSRSCFNKCAFCTIPYATTGKYRTLPVEKVYEMMTKLSAKYNTNLFTFVDETFEIKRMIELAKKIIDGKAKFHWYCETRFSPYINTENTNILYEGGCRKIQFGLESYNQRVLDKMKKNIKLEWIEPSIESCLKSEIAIHLFFMIGFPTESEEEAINTLRFTNKILQRSCTKYNNRFSTRGFGTFGLDKHSHVWMNPDKYNIEIIPDEINDLSLQRNYISKEGLTQQEADNICNLYSNNIIDKHNLKDFFEHKKLCLSEEASFIDSVNKTNMYINKKIEKKISFDSFSEELKLYINNNTIYNEFNINMFTGKEEKNINFYNAKYNTFYSAQYSVRKILDRIEGGENTFAKLDLKDIKNDIENLIYYKLLSSNNKKVINSEDKLIFNKDILKFEEGNSIYVMNKSTGNTMKMNRLSYKILNLFNKPQRSSYILNQILNLNFHINIDEFKELIKKAIEFQIIYVY